MPGGRGALVRSSLRPDLLGCSVRFDCLRKTLVMELLSSFIETCTAHPYASAAVGSAALFAVWKTASSSEPSRKEAKLLVKDPKVLYRFFWSPEAAALNLLPTVASLVSFVARCCLSVPVRSIRKYVSNFLLLIALTTFHDRTKHEPVLLQARDVSSRRWHSL